MKIGKVLGVAVPTPPGAVRTCFVDAEADGRARFSSHSFASLIRRCWGFGDSCARSLPSLYTSSSRRREPSAGRPYKGLTTVLPAQRAILGFRGWFWRTNSAICRIATNAKRTVRGTDVYSAVCRKKSGCSWFKGKPTRGSGEINQVCSFAALHPLRSALAARAWNPLQIVFQRFYSTILGPDSWFGGSRLVVRGKRTRGLGEIGSWFEGNDSWSGGSPTRGLREETRGLREDRDVKALQIEGARSLFSGLLLFKYLLFLCCSTTTGRIN